MVITFKCFYRWFMPDTGAAEDYSQSRKDCGGCGASSPTKDAAGGQARRPSPLAVNGLFVQAQVLLESVPHTRRRKGGSLPF